LAVAAFGFFLAKLNVFLDSVAGGRLPSPPAEGACAIVAVADRHVGLALG
jgi:putative membrane protein